MEISALTNNKNRNLDTELILSIFFNLTERRSLPDENF